MHTKSQSRTLVHSSEQNFPENTIGLQLATVMLVVLCVTWMHMGTDA